MIAGDHMEQTFNEKKLANSSALPTHKGRSSSAYQDFVVESERTASRSSSFDFERHE